MSLAPVVIFTFNRLDHTKKTIEALKKNILADESEIFIFSDGPRNKEEEKRVNEVRQYLKDLKETDEFKNVSIIESEKNKGLANSVINGVAEVINKHGKIIVLEDDLVTSKYFLEFMNDALELYKDRSDIWSISGYTPNVKIPIDYNSEVYLIRRGASWGWATWEDRWKLNDWEIRDYNKFKKDSKGKKDFNIAGSDMSPMLNDQMEGRIDSWAIRWVYNQFKQNMWTIYPIKSLVKNIGNDLSGTHTPITNRYDVELTNQRLNLDKDVEVSSELCVNFSKFYNLNFCRYIALFIKKIGLYKQARSIRNNILKSKIKNNKV